MPRFGGEVAGRPVAGGYGPGRLRGQASSLPGAEAAVEHPHRRMAEVPQQPPRAGRGHGVSVIVDDDRPVCAYPGRRIAASKEAADGIGCRPPAPGGAARSRSRSVKTAPGTCPAAYSERPGGPPSVQRTSRITGAGLPASAAASSSALMRMSSSATWQVWRVAVYPRGRPLSTPGKGWLRPPFTTRTGPS